MCKARTVEYKDYTHTLTPTTPHSHPHTHSPHSHSHTHSPHTHTHTPHTQKQVKADELSSGAGPLFKTLLYS